MFILLYTKEYMLLAILYGVIFFGLCVWSAVIAWHLHTYVLRDDKVHGRMFAAFFGGSLVFIGIILILFVRVPWNKVSKNLGPDIARHFRGIVP